MAIIPVAVVSATLALIAWQDWHYRRIPNLAVVTLTLCALFYGYFLYGTELERSLNVYGLNVALALLIAIPGFVKGLVGAGDVKLMLALALLWPTVQFLQAFSFGVLGLFALCFLFDAMTGQRNAQQLDGNAQAATMPHMNALMERGLPLGTAFGFGYLLTSLI